jgi:hypothetical protein
MVTMNLIPTLQSTHRRPEFEPLLVISLHNNPQHLCTVDSTSGVSLIILLVIVGSLAHTPTHMFNIMTVFAAPLLVAMFFRMEYSYKTHLSLPSYSNQLEAQKSNGTWNHRPVRREKSEEPLRLEG